MKLVIPQKINLSKETLACIGLFFFLVKIPIRSVLAMMLPTSGDVNTWISILLMYIPIMFIPFVAGEKKRVIDFIIVWVLLFAVCMITYYFHPEYKAWLFEGEFNIWLSIFRPDQAIYLYLFIRLINNPEKIFKTLKWSAFLLLAYNLYKFIYFEFIIGHWEGTGVERGAEVDYNLGFGYDVLFLFVIFMVLGKRNSKLYYALAGLSLFCILMAGSRGPLIGVALIFLVQIFDWIKKKSLKYQMVIWSASISFIGVIAINFVELSKKAAVFLQSVGVSSRTIMKIAEGEITDDSGRARLYEIAMELIRTGGPFGNGIYGDRYVIASETTMWIGYCHQIALEILVDFGYLLGGIILLLMIRKIIIILFSRGSDWRTLFLLFLVTSSQLLLSGSYLYSATFWGTVAIAICWKEENKQNMTEENTEEAWAADVMEYNGD